MAVSRDIIVINLSAILVDSPKIAKKKKILRNLMGKKLKMLIQKKTLYTHKHSILAVSWNRRSIC